MSETVRIFVGTPANNEDLEAQAVLDHGLRLYSSRSLDITWMMLSRDPSSFWYSDPQRGLGWHTDGWATPFSALRWAIPAACDFRGRAIYMDSDMIPRADIAELWTQDIPAGKMLLAKGGEQVISCVMLMDCERMRAMLPPIQALRQPGTYRHVRSGLQGKTADYVGDWNCRDGEGYKDLSRSFIKMLHYTSIPTQPNHRHARQRLTREGKSHWYPGPDRPHPRQEFTQLFDEYLSAAMREGRGPEHFREEPEFGDYGPMKQYSYTRAA